MLGLNLAVTRRSVIGSGAWTPASLFASGEQGAWFDPSDLSTLYQDTSGTAAAVGSPVGLMLDKRLGTFGSELVTNGTLSNGTTGYSTAAGSAIAAVGGELEVTVASSWYAQQDITTVVGKVYRLTATLRAAGTNTTAQSARIQISGGPTTVVDANGTTKNASMTFVATGTTTQIIFGVASGGAAGTTGEKAYFGNISVKEVIGNHASQSTAASRPILRQSGALYYLEFDGVDDQLVTPSLSLSGGDAVTVTASMRKVADTAQALIVGAALANGSFEMFAPNGANASYNLIHRGTLLVQASAVNALYAAPQTGVLTGQGKISTDTALLRLNGAQIASSASDQGSGNYTDSPLYIGRRSNNTLPFGGWLFGLTVRVAASNASDLGKLETYAGKKCGVTI